MGSSALRKSCQTAVLQTAENKHLNICAPRSDAEYIDSGIPACPGHRPRGTCTMSRWGNRMSIFPQRVLLGKRVPFGRISPASRKNPEQPSLPTCWRGNPRVSPGSHGPLHRGRSGNQAGLRVCPVVSQGACDVPPRTKRSLSLGELSKGFQCHARPGDAGEAERIILPHPTASHLPARTPVRRRQNKK